jgi:ABC-type branched-subunit amino acid transport system ATPase component
LRAVRDLDLAVEEGEAVGLIGPNGAGKTTVFDLVSGALAPDSGRILLMGEDVTRLGPEPRAEAGLARTFQNGRAFANLTVEENALVGAQRLRAAAKAGAARWAIELAEALSPAPRFRAEELTLKAEAAAALGLFGDRLAPRSGDFAYSLSYANRRRLEIARALASRPKLLLLDEPTAGMNPSETAEMLGFLKRLKASGQAMVVIEHKLSLVMSLSDRVVVMDGGEKIAEGAPEGVARDPAVVEAYLGSTRPLEAGRRGGRALDAPRAGAAGPAPGAPLLRLESIDAFYGPVQALCDLSLEVRPGEIVCLLGGNASGKSTTMKAVLGLVRPRSGEVLWEGRPVTRLPTPERVRLGIASVPEARRVFPEMSVEENLRMGAYLRRDERAIKEAEERVLGLFPRLGERLRQKGGSLSGGEQQMLAMARALMSSPRLLCMDEPTMGLSPRYVDEVLATVAELNRGGLAVLLVEQNANQALGIAHRGYVLRNGSLALEGPAGELAGDERVREAYLGSGSSKSQVER